MTSDPGHVGPKLDPKWFDIIRQLILFALGVWLIIYAAVTSGHDVPFLITGVFLFGMVPLERVLDRIGKRHDHQPLERRDQ